MISCSLCEKSCRNPATLEIHMVSHTKEKPHKCHICSAALGLKGSLKLHIKGVHDGVKEIKKRNSHCPLCSYKCYSKNILQNHLRKHSCEFPFSCKRAGCEYKTKYETNLEQHVRSVHSNERPYECPSDGCNYKGKTRGLLRSHLRMHSNEKPFACQVPGCTYTCKRKSDLKTHNYRAHSDGKLFECSDCDFQTKHRSNLGKHLHIHAKMKRFKCQALNCNFASSHKSSVQRHFDCKHRKKEMKCTAPRCHNKYGSINLLKRHLSVHECKIWACPGDSCYFATRLKSCLLKHITRRHESLHSTSAVKPKTLPEFPKTAVAMETFHCRYPKCGYQTKFPHHYHRHGITHQEEQRRHVCSFCFSRFRSLSVLQAHVKRHIGEKPYKCSYCKHKTVSSIELRFHARNIHHIHVIPRGKEDELRQCRTCNVTCFCYSEFVLHSMTHLTPVVALERLCVQVA